MPSPAPLDRALAYLDEHINLEATAGHVEGLSLARMRALAKNLGDPQVDYPVVHITGTNGKGSTAALIAALLTSAGLSVGTYSSPHVSAINERLQRGGEPIDDDALAHLLLTLRSLEDEMQETPSWFELMTAAAFTWFADEAVDVAVVEVGKLGRFDATNVADARVAVVTNVGYDHTDGAPGWREAIAGEKAGIIKPGSTLVLGETDESLRPLFEAEAAAHTIVRGEDFQAEANGLAVGGRVVDLHTPRSDHRELFVSLHGYHQGRNAAIALAAAEEFLDAPLHEDVVAEAFGSMSLPGRFEVLGRQPLVVVDGAHNPDGAAAARRTMDEDFAHGGRRIVVLGMMREREPVAMLESVGAAGADLLIACSPPWVRAMPADELGRAADSLGIEVEVIADVGDALARALALADDDDAIFVLGSLYVAGAARDAYADLV